MARFPHKNPGGAPRALPRFDRRVGALAVVALCVLMTLALQVFRLSVVEHTAHAENVERHLVRKRLLPASRGRILDRNGVVLAADRASWDVLLAYDAIAGRWATDMARREVTAELGREQWRELSTAERANAILARQPRFDGLFDDICARLAEAGGVDRSELDRRFDDILSRAAREVTSRRSALAEREVRLFGDQARLSEIDRERVVAQRTSHVILADVPDEVAFYFQRLAEEFPGAVTVEPSTRRVMPWSQITLDVDRSRLPSPIRSTRRVPVVVDGVADHIIGRTRTQVFAEELARRPLADPATGEILDLSGYRSDRDVIGASGVERVAESRLRGRRGMLTQSLKDGSESRVEPANGSDVELTIDIRLQSRIHALFDPAVRLARIEQYQRGFDAEGDPRGGPLPLGYELDGAVVVLDIRSGEVLAAVSVPSVAEGALMSESRRLRESPGVFRPTEGVYPPGSIVKPLVFCAAAAEGLVTSREQIVCNGHFFPDRKDSTRCWIYRPAEGRDFTHGPLDAREALARSCNIYFYALAQRLGPERLVAWLGRFGVGTPSGAGLAWAPPNDERASGGDEAVQAPMRGDAAGFAPSAVDLARLRERGDRVSPVLLGIGQGPLAWTPLHAAQAFATLARGGVVIEPRIVRTDVAPTRVDLGLPPDAVRTALDGLRASVSESFGTGHHITLDDGVREPLFPTDALALWGKTGTATAPLLALDGDKDGRAETRVRTDHAWFVGLAGANGSEPTIAIAVLLENGGSGGRVAAPMAAAVLSAIAAEGYLGADAQRRLGGNSPP